MNQVIAFLLFMIFLLAVARSWNWATTDDLEGSPILRWSGVVVYILGSLVFLALALSVL